MRFKISLTTRLSLIFSAVMLTVWWLSSFILISTLNGYFDNQDRDFLTGKLQLTEEFLKTETFRNKTDIKSLSEKINDAMVGHNGLFISIKNMENEKIVELYAKNSVVPAVLLNKSGDILDYMIQTEENNTVFPLIWNVCLTGSIAQTHQGSTTRKARGWDYQLQGRSFMLTAASCQQNSRGVKLCSKCAC